jgi:hypothetical protein
MAQYKGKQQTISSVSDILGFILEQSELPPDKRRPVRPPPTADSQAKDDYASTLVDALAMPGTFVGDQYLETINNLVNPEVAIQTQTGSGGSFKIGLQTLPEFFNNPDATIDKAFEKGRTLSKLSKIAWAGEQMRMLAGSTYAKKMGLFEGYGELKPVLERALGQSAMDSKSDRDKMWVADATDKLKKKGLISTINLQDLKNMKNSLSKNDPNYNRLVRQIAALENPNIQDTDAFRTLLDMEFEQRGKSILGTRKVSELTPSELEEFNKVRSAKNTLNVWKTADKYNASDIKRARENILKTENRFKEQFTAIKEGKTFDIGNGNIVDYSTFSEKLKQKELDAVKKNLQQLSSTKSSFSTIQFWSKLGKIEGTYLGIKKTLGPDSVENFFNGKFFDPKYGYFGCPSAKVKKSFTSKGSNGDWNSIKFVKSLSAQKTGKKTIIDGYNDRMVELYYLNPVTWMKSLVNGEGFAWIADKHNDKLLSMWNVKDKDSDFFKLTEPEFWKFFKEYKDLDPVKQAAMRTLHPEYDGILGHIAKGLKNQNSAFAKKFAKSEELLDKLSRFEGLAKVFSTPTRALNWINENTLGKVQQGVRNGLFKVLSKMKMFGADDAAMALLESWKVSGGAALSSAISKAIIGALGAAGTAIGGPLGTVLTFAISIILDKIVKEVTKYLIYGVIGLFGLVFLIGSLMEYGNRSKVDAYSRIVPAGISYNPEFEDYGESSLDSLELDINGIPSLSDEECILSNPSAPCSQGYVDSMGTHSIMRELKPVDLSFLGSIFSPQFCDKAAGNCYVTHAWESYSYDFREACSYEGQDPNEVNPGGELWLEGSYTDDTGANHSFRLEFYHVVLYVPHIEDKSSAIPVGPGEPLAKIGTTDDGLNINACWHHPHVHYMVKLDGRYVDPLDFLNSWGCSLPTEEQCTL